LLQARIGYLQILIAELLLKTSSFAVGQSLGKEPPRSLPNENASHPDGAIVDRDLNATPILPITEDWGSRIHTMSRIHQRRR
jgi:hypothetical protein